MPSLGSSRALGGGLAVLLLTACSRTPQTPPQQVAPAPAAQAAASISPSDSAHPKIVVLGDSLSAGLGLLEVQSYPALLQEKLNVEGYGWDVVNAGISGDTSAAGLQRIDRALNQGNVRTLALELDPNDGLRALPVPETKNTPPATP